MIKKILSILIFIQILLFGNNSIAAIDFTCFNGVKKSFKTISDSLIISGDTSSDNIIKTSYLPKSEAKDCPYCLEMNFCLDNKICKGRQIEVFNGSAGCYFNPVFEWDYGDGTPLTESPTHIYADTGDFIITLYIKEVPGCTTQSVSLPISVRNCDLPCYDCISSFSPEPGKKYLISAWVKEENAAPTKTTYNNPQIFVVFPNLDSATTTIGPLIASGNIIDGWQKTEAVIDIPANATDIRIRLLSLTGNSYFDDIRISPFDATMKSYVYDPVYLRLVSELDERNYATFYEYDEEGKLVRVKKETEKGIMTIKESKDNKSK